MDMVKNEIGMLKVNWSDIFPNAFQIEDSITMVSSKDPEFRLCFKSQFYHLPVVRP